MAEYVTTNIRLPKAMHERVKQVGFYSVTGATEGTRNRND